LALMNVVAPGDAFIEWGWRMPFLLSIVLMFVGWWIRRGVDESPVFENMRGVSRSPLRSLLRDHWRKVLVAALVFAGNGTVGYMVAGGYIQSYGSTQLGMERGVVLWAVT